MYEIVTKTQWNNVPSFQARLSGVPLGAWHPTKQDAVRDILRCGVRAEVIDRTGVVPRVDRHSLGWQ
jgi:hypothetical protein